MVTLAVHQLISLGSVLDNLHTSLLSDKHDINLTKVRLQTVMIVSGESFDQSIYPMINTAIITAGIL